MTQQDAKLQCIYAIQRELDSSQSFSEIMTACLGHLRHALPAAMLFGLRLNDCEYGAAISGESPAPAGLEVDIVTTTGARVALRAGHWNGVQLSEDDGLFLRQVARMIACAAERRDLRTETEEDNRRIAELKNEISNLFEKAPVPLLVTTVNGDVVRANPAFYRLLGLPEDGSVQVNFVRDQLYVRPETRSRILERVAKEGRIDALELTLIARDGTPIPLIGSYTFVDIDGVRHLESAYKDISIRKELERKLIEHNENLEKNVCERTVDLENQKNLLVKKNRELLRVTEKLREHKTRLQTLFTAITDMVILIDPDLNVLMSNQKNVRSKGKCYKKVFGRDERCEDCLVERLFAERSSVTQERVVDGEYYVLQAYPIFDAKHQIVGALEISRVVTKEKNMERQLLQADKLASLGQLVSGIGHEINNPNTFIRGNLHIVQEAMNDIFPILDSYCKSHPDLKVARLSYDIFRKNLPILVEDMVQGADRIKGIVDGLKKFARQDDGYLNEVVNINTVAESCLRLVDNQVRRTADVKVDLDPYLPTIVGNSQKLQQVIVNIVINASQAIERPKGVIELSSKFDGKEIVLKVKDNGKGMDEKTISQIFDPFFTTKRNRGGTGLGLSIAYGIIKEHKGRIEVISEVGAGTSFSIHLPLASAEE